MTSIKLTVSGASARAEVDGLLTSGMVGVPVAITYDSAWDGLTKALVCRGGSVIRTILDVDGTATVPHECMIANATLQIGVEGRNVDGTLVIPTVWARCGLICSGANAEADPSTDPTLPVWAQIQRAVGNLDDLNTEAKDTLVAAINEAARTGGGGGGSTVELDTTLTQSGKAADAKAVGDAINLLSEEIANLQTSGLTTAQINALDGMFKVAVYDDSKDVSGAYAAFKAAFGLVDSGDTGGGGEEPPVVTTYTITAELVNVTSNNSATSVTEGASYTATLTADDGYKLDTVSVLMGGVDVTADVYADGAINIASVTGNVEIIASATIIEDVGATLPKAGLVDFFDMRNVTATDEGGGKLAIYATNGNGNLFTWSTTALTESNEYGAKLTNRDWTLATSETLGEERTVIFMSYNGCVSYRNMLSKKSTNTMTCIPMYTNAGGTTVSGTSSNIEFTPFGNNYLYPAARCNADTLSLFTDNQKLIEYNAADFEDFSKWVFPPVRPKDTNPYLTAIAIYNRALSDSEIVDVVEYLKTLEVTA